jgi:Flp pilus assembly protein TadG
MTKPRPRSSRGPIPRSRSSRRAALRPERGATLVLVAVLMVALLSLSAFAVDFSRLFVYRNQLRTVTDAAALAGARQVLLQAPLTATDSAIAYGTRNKVNGAAATVNAADVQAGSWSDATQSFTPLAWTSTSVNAVKVTSDYTANYLMARVMGQTSIALSRSSIAAVGSTNAVNCIAPWGIPYQSLLWSIGHTVTDTGHVLTAADITTLRQNSAANNIMFKMANGTGSQATVDATGVQLPGNYYGVQFPPARWADGTANSSYTPNAFTLPTYGNAISGTYCSPQPVHVGDWLEQLQGTFGAFTGSALDNICPNGTRSGQYVDCTTDSPSIVAPIYAGTSTAASGLTQVQVKYIGAFTITKYGASGAAQGEVYGYFNYMVTHGVFSMTPGPTGDARLVQ